MKTAIKDPQITELAERYFEENKTSFVENLAQEIETAMVCTEEEIKQGKFMDIKTFEQKLYSIDLSK